MTGTKDSPVVYLCRLMRENRIGAVIIVKDRHPVGIITESDVVEWVSSYDCREMSSLKAGAVMKTPVLSVGPEHDVKAAIGLMMSRRVRRLAVVEHHRLAGIITYGDILSGIQRELAESRQQTDRLKDQVVRDSLTKLHNQLFFKNSLSNEVERVKRYGGLLSLLMIDIDHFKKVNDTFGHDAGDYVLQRVAFLIRNNVRKINMVCRYGGDEFAIIAPISDLSSVIRMAERLRQLVERTKFHIGGKIIHTTISIGIAAWHAGLSDGKSLMVAADENLYKSKRGGRNRVTF